MANNNILNLLTDDSTVTSLSQKTDTSRDAISSLLGAAVPMLMSNLASNASTSDGALSLLSALGQHNTNASAAQVISNADTTDGAKILEHILGGKTNNEIKNLAKKTGLTTAQVSAVLNNLTPALLSTLSNAVNTTAQQGNTALGGINLSDGLDLGDVMGLVNLVSSNKKPAANSGLNAGSVISLLTSLLK